LPKVKLIAIDLDDTLLRTDLTISARAKNAIMSAAQKGISITLATGRMYASALPFAQELNLNLPLITYQGALVKYADGRLVYHKPLPQQLARELVRFILPYGYHLNVYMNDELYMDKDSPEGRRYVNTSKVPVHLEENLVDNINVDPSKLLIIAEEPQLDVLACEVRNAFGDIVNITKSKPYFLEIGHVEASKGLALRDLAESLGYCAGEVMAIGDSWNDFDMLEYAGFSVAMENSMPEIKKIAKYVTLNNDDDGVAEAIERWAL